jgi:hypothetical protein
MNPMATSRRIQSDNRAADDTSGAVERLDVVPLLKAYRAALRLARHPPASLDLPPALERLHRWLRPTLGCDYFVTRQVRRRVGALERALTARVAIGEVDENDRAELEALRTFRSSLAPPPGRGWTVAGLIAAILLTQVLVGRLSYLLLYVGTTAGKGSSFETALSRVSLSPDVRSVGDVGRALTSADFFDLGVVVLSVVCVLYLFARPFACGYRLAQLCLGGRVRLSERRRESPLCRQAARLAIPAQEAAVARIADAEFQRDAPIDIVVKAAPCIAIGYVAVGLTRFGGGTGISTREAAWMLASAALLGSIAWLSRRVAWLGAGWAAVLSLVAVLGVAVMFQLIVEREARADSAADVWLAIYAVTLMRLAWLAWYARGGGRTLMWLAAPLAVIVAIGIIARYHDSGTFDRAEALAIDGLSAVPHVSRYDLQVLLVSHRSLVDADLRAQDLHDLSLRDKDLTGAQLALADLRATDLQGADLSHADLHGARAFSAVLQHANLKNADLRCSDLGSADLRGADLRHAKLSGATFVRAVADDQTLWPTGFDVRQHEITHSNHVVATTREAYSFDDLIGCLISPEP